MKNIKNKIALAVMTTLFTLSTVSPAIAGSVNVSKLRLELDDKKTSDYITLSNQDTMKSSFETSVFKWRQKDAYIDKENVVQAENVLTETEDVFISPSTIVILPEKSRTLRAIVEDKDKAFQDYSYRIQVKQLDLKEKPVETNTISLLFNITMPLFVLKEPVKEAKNFKLETSVKKVGNKEVLSIKNLEKQHIQILSVLLGKVKTGKIVDGKEEEEEKTVEIIGYILPGVTNMFILPEAVKGAKVLNIRTDKGDLTINL